MKEKIQLWFDKIKRLNGKPAAAKLVFIALGISSTIWFLIRVIPKPQRATYPCMRAAAPLMSTFVIYLLTLSGSVFAFQKAKEHFKKAKFIYASSFFVASVFCAFIFFANRTEDAYSSTVDVNSILSNAPVGVGHGIYPGRVAWVFDPEVAKWDGSNKYWWDEKSTSQVEADKMLSAVLLSLTGKKSGAKAWDALFKNFNKEKKNIKKGYTISEKNRSKSQSEQHSEACRHYRSECLSSTCICFDQQPDKRGRSTSKEYYNFRCQPVHR